MLKIVPINLALANAFVSEHHRHHKAARGCKFCVAVADAAGRVRGVMIVGRPVARHCDDGETLEVTRLATDGAPNACSMLYGVARRVARELGYRAVQTYILTDEPGTSLRAAGWQLTQARTRGGSWNVPSRARVDAHPLQPKALYRAALR